MSDYIPRHYGGPNKHDPAAGGHCLVCRYRGKHARDEAQEVSV